MSLGAYGLIKTVNETMSKEEAAKLRKGIPEALAYIKDFYSEYN